MNIVDTLDKLGFSFWQLLIIFVIFYLKNDIKNILERINSVKVPGGEVKFTENNDSEIINELSDIKSKLENTSNAEIAEIIDNKIENKLIGALINIKKNTTHIWPSLKNREGSTFVAATRISTLSIIKKDLELLADSKYISFYEEKAYGAFKSNNIYELRIIVLNNELDKLILEAERY